MASSTDRIEKTVELRASRQRVWRALTNHEELEPATLVEFSLEETKHGTQLTVVESGFDRIPAARRAEAFRMNTEGWEGQLRNIEKHVAAG